MLTIDYSVRCRKEKVTDELKALVRRAIETALEFEEIEDDCEVSVTFVGNAGIRKFNAEYRGIDRVTDVLSFPLGEDGVYDKNLETGACILGDIVISVETAVRQAEEYGHGFARECAYLTTHSMLHLLGYDHVDEGEMKARMRAMEETIMSGIGLERK